MRQKFLCWFLRANAIDFTLRFMEFRRFKWEKWVILLPDFRQKLSMNSVLMLKKNYNQFNGVVVKNNSFPWKVAAKHNT